MNARPLCILTVLLALLPAPPALADSVAPGINSHYRQADFNRWLGTFESSGREVFAQRQPIVDALDLRPGMNVADVGAGTGFFALMFARAVGPRGRVWAVDIAPDFVRGIGERAREAGLDNVETVVNDDRSTGLPDGALDLVFTSDTYHHFEYPADMLASIHRALRPGGRLVIIDYRKEPGHASAWVMGHVRAGSDEVRREVEAAGFRLDSEHDFLRQNYYLVFEKLSVAP